MEDRHPILNAVLTLAAVAAFFTAFFWVFRDTRIPQQIGQAQKESVDQAAQARAKSDDQDRKIYADALANADDYQTAVNDCRALQIKYRLLGDAVICAKWEIARQVEEAVTAP
jgi:hypothetical protein